MVKLVCIVGDDAHIVPCKFVHTISGRCGHRPLRSNYKTPCKAGCNKNKKVMQICITFLEEIGKFFRSFKLYRRLARERTKVRRWVKFGSSKKHI